MYIVQQYRVHPEFLVSGALKQELYPGRNRFEKQISLLGFVVGLLSMNIIFFMQYYSLKDTKTPIDTPTMPRATATQTTM